ncbi:hypothetical protein MPC4_380025 [Methylocella tundrae]|uniref:Resolvase/invertase-type recombinase catalytic domain-containing protein n=1 Tax=Methylocella tundrae TaxID=227605 RepID=A0A8B6M8P1_METTU|nr:hypothetical protein MPC1_5120004 [Methylocella tundrae]VTZ51387.1 hypothetical protein MPC4_380025 [Methylocella tundrae]
MAKKITLKAIAPIRKGRGRSAARKHPPSPLDVEGRPKGMLIGYARVSTVDQNLALQRDALTDAGCGKIFTEQMSGAVTERPALHDALEYARSGDTLVVWKLDRLARSMKQLIETIEKLRVRNIGFRSLTEALDTTDRAGLACVPHVQRLGGIRAQPDTGTDAGGTRRRQADWPDWRTTAEDD